MKGLVGFGIGAAIGTIAGGLAVMTIMIITAKDKDSYWVVDEGGASLMKKTNADEVTETE